MANGWNQGSWGDIAWSGILNSTVQVNNPLDIAWNIQTWGTNAFGGSNNLSLSLNNVTATPNSIIILTGLELITELNSVTEVITVDAFPSGIELTTTLGTADADPDANVTGIELTTTTGTLLGYNRQGWGRFYWGEEVWGDSGIWVTASVTGQELTLTLDSITIQANANIDLTGEILTIAEGEVDPSPDATVTGIGMNVSLSTGSVIIGTATVDLTGIGLDIGLGTASGEAITLVDITGIGLDIAQGTASGQALVNVSVTGNGLTISQNSINTQIWTKINTGTVATWTEIDTAA